MREAVLIEESDKPGGDHQGGFGGVELAGTRECSVRVVIDRQNFHTSAALPGGYGRIEPSSIIYPFLKIFENSRFISVWPMLAIDTENNCWKHPSEYSYDFLVVATGAATILTATRK
jgi:NADH dehydrogenase FAD-containing subunit